MDSDIQTKQGSKQKTIDTKGVIKSRKSKRYRQYKDQ